MNGPLLVGTIRRKGHAKVYTTKELASRRIGVMYQFLTSVLGGDPLASGANSGRYVQLGCITAVALPGMNGRRDSVNVVQQYCESNGFGDRVPQCLIQHRSIKCVRSTYSADLSSEDVGAALAGRKRLNLKVLLTVFSTRTNRACNASWRMPVISAAQTGRGKPGGQTNHHREYDGPGAAVGKYAVCQEPPFLKTSETSETSETSFSSRERRLRSLHCLESLEASC